jgi:hypothetical protein
MKYTKFALVALVAVFTGCEEYFEKKDSEADGSTPYIAISAPADNSVFTQNQTIEIESLISDKDQVKELEVQVVKLAESTKQVGNISESVWSYKDFPVKNPVVIDTVLAASNLAPGNYLLTLNSIDKRTNVGIKEVHFTVK